MSRQVRTQHFALRCHYAGSLALSHVYDQADSAAKQSPTLDGAQFSQFFAILKHKVPDIVHSLLLPGMLFTFSETWLSLIRRVRQPFSNPTVPIPSRSTPVDQNLTAAQSLISILVEIPSRCDRARYAGIGTLWLVTHAYTSRSFYVDLTPFSRVSL